MEPSIQPETKAFLEREHGLLIGGEWAKPRKSDSLQAINPATAEPLARFAGAGEADVDDAVAAARAAFEQGPWPAMHAAQRSALLWQLADAIEAEGQVLTELEILDNGMPVTTAGSRVVANAARILRYYAGWPDKLTGRTIPADPRPGAEQRPVTYTRKEPIGVVAQITPWNYPLVMAVMKLAPALACGCTVVLKPDENTSLSALLLGELIRRVGVPPGVVNIVTGTGQRAGAALAAHDGVDKIALTGSTETGRAILRAAAGNLKRVTLELGGKSPFIVFPDADLDKVIATASRLGFFLQGQNCQCPSRLLIHEAVFAQVVEGIATAAQSMKIGPGWDPETRIGPLISARQRERVEGSVASGLADGAELVTGGRRIDSPGFFFQPTVFTGGRSEMRIVQEEIFGPVLVAQAFRDLDLRSVARMANDTIYGLVASVWTRDVRIAHELTGLIKAGTVGVNHHGGGDIYAPFGGYKQSGWGREFGAESLDAYTETKTVVIRYD